MIKIETKVKVKHNYKKISKISQMLPKILPQITEDILKNIRGYAIKLERGHNEERNFVSINKY